MIAKRTLLAAALTAVFALGASALAWGQGMGCCCPGYGMAPGSMPYGMGPGPMHYGMGPGYMGYGAAPGYGGYGMPPGGMMYGMAPPAPATAEPPAEPLTVDDVRQILERQLEWLQNPNLKVGKIEQSDEDTVIGEIVTKDDSLVERYAVDRKTGAMQRRP